MPEQLIITLADLKREDPSFSEYVDRVAARVSQGEVIIAPLESSYVYLCDAFHHSAVARIHELRGDAPGTACQVAIASVETLKGITQQLPDSFALLATEFWPGLLTLMVRPNSALNWDLGDGGALDTFAVRVPNQDFLREIISRVGPVAIASASASGQGAALALDQISALPDEINIYIDGGSFERAQLSTVVAMTPSGGVDCTRIGAISLEDLRKVLPAIGASHF